MRKYLRDSAEFQYVYRNGKRYEGIYISVFVVDKQQTQHRLGVTASKKAVGKAVQRNRAKRLMRETFRLSELTLSRLRNKYDWVLNAKATILDHKLNSPLLEFQEIINKVGKRETADPR